MSQAEILAAIAAERQTQDSFNPLAVDADTD